MNVKLEGQVFNVLDKVNNQTGEIEAIVVQLMVEAEQKNGDTKFEMYDLKMPKLDKEKYTGLLGKTTSIPARVFARDLSVYGPSF